ncbi:MAG TPA: 8-amino-7-oxononanoate synthase [Terrimicrobiaceae bacterium]
MNFDQFLTNELERIQDAGLRRSLRVLDSPQGPEVSCDGRSLANFSSNDYLGLAAHPKLRAAARDALEKAGAGAGASRLVCGTHSHHQRLEDALARFKQTEAALSFSSGYAAALGTIPALAAEGDVIILDKLCHACLVDGARLSGASMRVFPHNRLEKLESHLRWATETHPAARVLVLVESVYSMDGDRAPLPELVELKDRFGAWLFVDEAHSIGVVGRHGRGLADESGLSNRIEVQMGTLGKALGSSGAYVCGSAALRDYLINRARSFIFSTAPPPHCAAASCAAVEILESDEGEALVEKLRENMDALALGLLAPAQSAIFPIIVGGEKLAMNASRRLLAEGFLVPAIRYPTVARGSARLRITVTAGHRRETIHRLAAVVGSALSECRNRPSP